MSVDHIWPIYKPNSAEDNHFLIFGELESRLPHMAMSAKGINSILEAAILKHLVTAVLIWPSVRMKLLVWPLVLGREIEGKGLGQSHSYYHQTCSGRLC